MDCAFAEEPQSWLVDPEEETESAPETQARAAVPPPPPEERREPLSRAIVLADARAHRDALAAGEAIAAGYDLARQIVRAHV